MENNTLSSLMKQNNELLRENNRLLKTMRRNARLSFIFRILWIALLIGLPFLFYSYFIEPYLSAGLSLEDRVTEALNSWLDKQSPTGPSD